MLLLDCHIYISASQQSAERLIRMGVDPSYVFNVGCPGMDLIDSIDFKHCSEFQSLCRRWI